jgi:DNA-binding MarR family transcriptional regulator
VTDEEIRRQAGHLVRRAHQVHDTIFAQETAGFDITSPQLAALSSIARNPGIEQTALADLIAYDCSTIGGLIDRLEAKKLVRRSVGKHDRRTRQLAITTHGRALLGAVTPNAARVHGRLLEPLAPAEREQFVEMLQRVVDVAARRGEARSDADVA